MTFEETCANLHAVHRVEDKDGYSVVSANSGCAFVVDKDNPHLGGNLEGGDLGTRYDNCVWPWALEKFKPKTFLDVGCAEGYVVQWFERRGVFARGVDGLPYNVKQCEILGLQASCQDLTKGPFLCGPIDLLWCCDMVEHVAEKYLHFVMETFQQASTVLLTNGGERNGKDGWHHVTNKPEKFWIDWMADGGFSHCEDLTVESREICPSGWYKWLGKVFTRDYGVVSMH